MKLFCAVLLNHSVYDLHGCTVHVDYIKSLICPTNAQTNYFKNVKLLETFKITTLAATCFGLHKTSSGRSRSALRQRNNIDFSYTCRS